MGKVKGGAEPMTREVRRAKAVALLSGGLDSTLAVLVLLEQGVEVNAVTFLTHFGCDIEDRSSCSRDPYPAAEKFGFDVRLCHLADKFIDMVRQPKFGFGKNANPCIDCRILMLKEAKALMERIGADLLVTGEVLGQRPMSQRRACFPLIDREAGVEGLVLRPLSAKLLPPTIAERQGLIDRDRLYDFCGRSRKPQMALAERLGLTDYPTPAAGCLLTDPNYSLRLKDLLQNQPDFGLKDIHLLRLGRHFRASPRAKIIVGRNEGENKSILQLADREDALMEVEGVGSPTTILAGKPSDEEFLLAASLTARYSDARGRRRVEVKVFSQSGDASVLACSPATQETCDGYRI